MSDNEQPLKNGLLERFISVESYDRGHSGGQEEVNNIASGLRYDLRCVDAYITKLENRILELKGIVPTT